MVGDVRLREMATITVGFGLTSAILLTLDVGVIGEVLAMVQLGALVGAPLATLLRDEARSWPVLIVIGIGLSIALTSLAAQSLVWFNLAGRELLVLVATGYGVALVWPLATTDRGRQADPAPAIGRGQP